jgi:hypothetical protein
MIAKIAVFIFKLGYTHEVSSKLRGKKSTSFSVFTVNIVGGICPSPLYARVNLWRLWAMLDYWVLKVQW